MISNTLRSAIEEFTVNIIERGFTESDDHSIDLRILKKGDDYIIRIRDNCALFDPKKQLETSSDNTTVAQLAFSIRRIHICIL